MIENNPEQTFLLDQIKEHFGLELATQLFIAYCFFLHIVSIMFIFLCQWHKWLDLPGTQMLFSHFYSYSYAEATSITACCHFWGHADPWIFSVFQHLTQS
jgi:hypothetical protein